MKPRDLPIPTLLTPALALLAIAVTTMTAVQAAADPVILNTRSRILDPARPNAHQVVERPVALNPAHTALVASDMWVKHQCPDAT
ncbi:MAG: hypothetical protein AB7O66_09330, partial [Limisphaerales bacterium]